MSETTLALAVLSAGFVATLALVLALAALYGAMLAASWHVTGLMSLGWAGFARSVLVASAFINLLAVSASAGLGVVVYLVGVIIGWRWVMRLLARRALRNPAP